MFQAVPPKISSPIVYAIEDAILFGNIKELHGVLDMVSEDVYFPDNLRYGLEALMHFRAAYGKGGDLEPTHESDKQQTQLIESTWGRELIEMTGHYPDMTEAKYA